MTWDQIVDAAENAVFLDSTLRRKDTARLSVGSVMEEYFFGNPELTESPEETIENFCRGFNVKFSEDGDVVDCDLFEKT